ncbi:MAG: molybdopterin cofactor-binding domain-containing protein, partial [bacterium]
MSTLKVSRRTFLKSAGIVGGGLIIGVSLTGCGSRPLPIESINGSFVPNAFLQITPDNEIIFYCPRDEMGQGVTTGLTTLIAEELDVEPAQITIRFAGVHSDYNNPEFGAQGTGGSTSTRVHFQQLRQAGATARELLCRAAANELDVNRIDVTTRDGYIQAGGQNLPYGRFATAAQTVEIPDEVPLKDSRKFKYIGRNFKRLDGIEKATGTAVFGIDVDLPDMHYAVVKRSPVHGGKVKSVARDKALQMPGVTDILEIGSGIAVVAKSYWQARQACQALDIEWEDAPLSGFSDKQIRDDYQ